MNFEEKLAPFGLTTQQIQHYQEYAQLLIQQNKVMNLTAIDDVDGILEKHFVDCLLIKEELSHVQTFGDVGSGAGFPGLVLAIACPEIEFTLIEPTKKRCNFLEWVVNHLKLTNVTIINGRAEDVVKELRESFDIVSARAVANLTMLSELCLPLVKVKGRFIAMKGSKALEEVEEAQTAIKILGGRVDNCKKSMLSDGSLRYNVIIQKIKKTPLGYPRMYAQIKKNPILNKKGQ